MWITHGDYTGCGLKYMYINGFRLLLDKCITIVMNLSNSNLKPLLYTVQCTVYCIR